MMVFQKMIFWGVLSSILIACSSTQIPTNHDDKKLLVGQWRCEAQDTFSENRYFSRETILENGVWHSDALIFVIKNDVNLYRYQSTDSMGTWRLKDKQIILTQTKPPKIKMLVTSREKNLLDKAESQELKAFRLGLEQAWAEHTADELVLQINKLNRNELETSLKVGNEIIHNNVCQKIQI